MAQERMPQVQLPVFPDGVTHITSEIAFERREGKVCYFNGHLPVFIHDCEDLAAFRLFSSQLVINGNATQSEISRAFGVPLVTVKRYVKLYRAGGPRAFFAAPSRRRGSKLTPELLVEAQALLDEGLEVPDAARRVKALLLNGAPSRPGGFYITPRKGSIQDLRRACLDNDTTLSFL